jgi:hypothetical protein
MWREIAIDAYFSKPRSLGVSCYAFQVHAREFSYILAFGAST